VRAQLPRDGAKPTKGAVLAGVRDLLRAEGAAATRWSFPVTRHRAPLATSLTRRAEQDESGELHRLASKG
jgi:hypothetical protein